MRLVRYSHSCVRLEADGRTLVIDPGVWSEPQALHGAGAVLVTHFHADPRGPVAAGRARRPGVCAGADPGRRHHGGRGRGGVRTGRVRRPRPRRRHASVAGGEPDLPNLGYLVDGLYHPGDALHVPDGRVDTLLVPLQASWLKLAEALDFVRAVRPRRAYGIHDAQVNERGREGPNHWLGRTGAGYRWLAPGEAADLTG